MKYYTNKNAGFSLVETFVAITILLIVIVGPMTISNSTARSTSYSSEQVVAFFLAQEGLELAQKARDDMALDSTLSWDDFVDDNNSGPFVDRGVYRHCFITNYGCPLTLTASGEVVVKGSDPTRENDNCNSDGSRCRLHYAENGELTTYTYSATGSTTPYTRIIRFEETAPNEVRVEAWVYWRSGNLRSVQEVRAETYLYNVFDN